MSKMENCDYFLNNCGQNLQTIAGLFYVYKNNTGVDMLHRLKTNTPNYNEFSFSSLFSLNYAF